MRWPPASRTPMVAFQQILVVWSLHFFTSTESIKQSMGNIFSEHEVVPDSRADVCLVESLWPTFWRSIPFPSPCTCIAHNISCTNPEANIHAFYHESWHLIVLNLGKKLCLCNRIEVHLGHWDATSEKTRKSVIFYRHHTTSDFSVHAFLRVLDSNWELRNSRCHIPKLLDMRVSWYPSSIIRFIVNTTTT